MLIEGRNMRTDIVSELGWGRVGVRRMHMLPPRLRSSYRLTPNRVVRAWL